MKNNKYYACLKRRTAIRSRGSITISPNNKIVKKIEHTCNTLKNENHPSITEYEKTGGKTKIDGHFYYFNSESMKKKQILYVYKKKY
jgi:hypothetical protein